MLGRFHVCWPTMDDNSETSGERARRLSTRLSFLLFLFCFLFAFRKRKQREAATTDAKTIKRLEPREWRCVQLLARS